MTQQPPHPPRRNYSDDHEASYRAGVGITLFNREGHILLAERLDYPGSWQMPQGGINEGEEFEAAVFREMEEEIGTRNARILQIMDEWIHYNFPAATSQKLWGGKYRGQRQKWVALRFLGQDSEIRLDTHTSPEFSHWQWVPIYHVLDYVVPFKHGVYERVMKEFSRYAKVGLGDGDS